MNMYTKVGLTVIFLAFFSSSLYAQQQTITGTVTDGNTQEPLPGVNIAVQGTSAGTATDADGQFELEVPAEADTLLFSFIGYESQAIPIQGRSTINVGLVPQTYEGDEMVVIGYGETSKRLLTTSISGVGGESIEKIPISNIGDGLKGKISGVRFYDANGLPGGDAPTIRIRGGSSINRSNAPLILVDGIERSLSDLNPNDIDDVTVLKDAASTAIYGSRASNGVVLVTTKRGQQGKAPRITFEASTGFQERIQQRELMDAEEYIRFSRANVHPNHPNYDRYISGDNQSASSGNTESSIYSTRYLQPDEEVPAGWQSIEDPIDPSKTLIFTDTDYQDVMFDRALWQNHNLTVSGGSETVNYRANLGYTDDEGVSLSSGWNRLSTRGNADVHITEDLIFSGDLSYSESNTEIFGNQTHVITRGAYAVPPTQKPRWNDGTPTHGFNATSPNPLFHDYIHEGENIAKRYDLGGKLDWFIGDKFQLTIDGRHSVFNREMSEFEKANQFRGDRPARFRTWRRNRTNIDNNVQYNDQIDSHSFSTMIGFSYMYTDHLRSDIQASGASSDKVTTINAAPELVHSSTNITEEALLGTFGRVMYDYNEKYLFSATFRTDGSSRFAKENRWGFFPGGSAAWVISEEPFIQEVNALSLLKLRTSYGLTGNNSVGLYDAYGVYNLSQSYAGNAGIRATTMPNQTLKWETTQQLDVGLDLGLFNDRFVLAADYFYKLTNDLLFTVPLPNTTGFDDIIQNVGQVKYEGFELEITSENIQSDNFSWTSDLTLGYVQNEVIKLPDNGIEKNRIGGWVDANGNRFGGIAEGEPLGRIYAPKVSHIIHTLEQLENAHYDESSSGWRPEDGSFVTGRKNLGDYEWTDRDGDGRITNADQFLLGNAIPHTTGGLTNTFQYNNWSFNVVLDWAIGHSVMDQAYQWTFLGNFQNNFAMSRELLDNSWQEPSDTDVKYARWQPVEHQLNSNFRRSDVFHYNADYLAIREITLGYGFSSNFVQRIGAQDVNVYASVNNLHYFTQVKGVSPEFGTSNTRGDNKGYPMVRKVTFGLEITF